MAMGIDLVVLLRNTAPIAVVSALLMVGIAQAPHAMVRGFTVFGRIVAALSVAGLVLGASLQLLGFDLVVDMAPLDEGLLTVGRIGVTLAGAYVLVELLSRLLRRPLGVVGGTGPKATLGVLACLAHAIPMFQNLKSHERGKVAACAFSVSGSYMLASSLAFLAGVQPQMMARCCSPSSWRASTRWCWRSSWDVRGRAASRGREPGSAEPAASVLVERRSDASRL